MRILFFHGRPSPQRTLVGIQKNPFVAAAATGMLLLRVGLGGGTMEAAPLVLNPDGAWCWFQDERAVIHNRQLTVTSITRSGDLQLTTWNLGVGSVVIDTLRRGFDHDDHNVAGLLVRQDHRLMAFYSRHGVEPRMYYRVARPLGAGYVWEAEQSLTAGTTDNFTYANPFELRGERNRIYLFWRGIDWNPTWSASDDNGQTWSQAANHIYFRKGERPYVKYASNGRDTIHFAFTEAHPERPFPTSLYHAYYRKGCLYTSDGKPVRELTQGPIHPQEATRIYDGSNPVSGRAWVWAIALEPDGHPIIVYTSHPRWDDIRYRYARWNGKAWEDRQIAFGGVRLYAGEEHYAGGICLDPDNPKTVFLSSNVDIQTGKPNGSGHYEIYRGSTSDHGQTWQWQAITSNSSNDNLRPLVPARHPGKTFVLWFRGVYRAYTDYRTEVVAFTDARNLPPMKEPQWRGTNP